MVTKAPKIKDIPSPASPPTRADASIIGSGGEDQIGGFSSLISNAGGSTGLVNKAKSLKKSLIGSN